MVQVPLMATLVPTHVLVSLKSDDTVPVIVMLPLAKVKAEAPVFFTVTVCLLKVFNATFGNARLAGVSVTTGNAPALPVPVRTTDCGLPVALSVATTVAVRLPIAIGENVTQMLDRKS